MAFGKPYPPDPITYVHYNALIDALEARFGAGAVSYMKDRTRIVNSYGNLFDFVPGGVQDAIDDIYGDTGGTIWLPKGKVIETDQWLLNQIYPIHIYGAGMCWHGEDRGTMIQFNLANGVNCVQIYTPGQAMHFGGLYDMTLYPVAGNQDVVYLDSISDWHLERVYMNLPKRHGLHVKSTADVWNLWIKDCLIENAVGSGIRLDGGAGAGVILKSYFLNNYFYSNNIDVEMGALDDVVGKVRLCQFHNNQHFNADTIAMKLYRKCESIIIANAIIFKSLGDAIDIDDDGVGNLCKRINIGPLLIDGDGSTPNGIDLGGFTDHVVIGPGQIFDVTGVAVNEGINVTNITKIGLYES